MTYNIYQDKDNKIRIYEEIIDDFSDTIKQKADPIMWMGQSILKLTKREKKPSEFLRNGLILILKHYHNYKIYEFV